MAETNTTTEATVLQVPTTLKSLIEALIFAAQDPLAVKQIQAMYEYRGLNGESRGIEPEEITRIVEELNGEYAASGKPYRIVQIAGGYQFATLLEYAEWLGKLYKEQARRKLSPSSIETLAIIAYKQPITKPEIESIRGVNCDYVLKTLLEKELATIVGRATTVGRPLLYGTTKEFLKHFGLNDVTDLPRPREIEEILGESQFETERRMLEAQEGIHEKKEEDFKSRLPHIPKRKPGLDNEVKIIPRKKTRDIKVREGSGEDRAQKKVEEASPFSADSAVSAEALKASEEFPAPAEIPKASSEDIPKIEKLDLSPPDQAPEVEVEGDEQSTALDQLLPVASSAPAPEEVAHEEPMKSEEESAVTVGAGGSVTRFDEPIVSDLSETESESEANGEILSPVPPEMENATEEGSDSNVLREALPEFDQLTLSTISEPEQQESVEQTEEDQPLLAESTVEVTEEPSSVLPSTAQDQSVPDQGSHAELLTEPSPDQHTTLQPKSRWQTWKEKIQEFIRKLFG
jgi:segregation and condensation protein B